MTSAVGAVVICATGIFTAAVAHAEPVPTCGVSPTSWADDSATYTGAFFYDADITESVGINTELVIRAGSAGLTLSGWKAVDIFTGIDAQSYPFTEVALERSADGSYHAETILSIAPTVTKPVTFTITPLCFVNGEVAALSATMTTDGTLMRTAKYNPASPQLLRGEPAFETGNENHGKADNSH